MNLDVVKKHFYQKGENYVAGRAMALSFKPLTINDVKDAYNQAIEDVFNSAIQGGANNNEYYVLKEENGFLRMLYRCRTIEGIAKHLPEELTMEHIAVLMNKGMGAIRYEVDDNTVYHILTIEQWDKMDEL